MWLSGQIEVSSQVAIHFRRRNRAHLDESFRLPYVHVTRLRAMIGKPPLAREMWLSQVEGGVKFTAKNNCEFIDI